MIHISRRAYEHMTWMLKQYVETGETEFAFDLEEPAESYETHPDVLAVRELSRAGLVSMTEGGHLEYTWGFAAALTDDAISLTTAGPEVLASVISVM